MIAQLNLFNESLSAAALLDKDIEECDRSFSGETAC
jgi:hypothetical protein